MTSEDPSFYTNHGFIEESIRKSIATDIKEKKFKRGGSTISMQLIKNAFLSREKTLSRKIEEILIVWMIENNHIMTKDRMLEVYFNIVEWGSNIYGIGEARVIILENRRQSLPWRGYLPGQHCSASKNRLIFLFARRHRYGQACINYFNLIGKMMASSGMDRARQHRLWLLLRAT